MILPGLYCRIPMRRRVFTSVAMALVLGVLPVRAQESSNPRETLKQYVADLQRNPDDQSLRERIIKLALDMRPPPATPPEALELEGAAEYAFKNAKNEADFADAAKQYEKALLVAPWKATDYFNLGVAQEKARQLRPAIQSFELYLLGAPNANDSEDVRKRIGGLRFASERTERQEVAEKAKQEEAERRKQQENARLQSSEGTWVDVAAGSCPATPAYKGFQLTIAHASNGELIATLINLPEDRILRQTITDRHLHLHLQYGIGHFTDRYFEYDLSLSADGKELIGSRTYMWHGKVEQVIDETLRRVH